jgi:hypothetical protein
MRFCATASRVFIGAQAAISGPPAAIKRRISTIEFIGRFLARLGLRAGCASSARNGLTRSDRRPGRIRATE